MYVETVPNRNSPPAVLLREGWREGHRVHKRTIANLSHWPASKVARLRQLLKDQPLVHPEEAFTIDRALPHGHVALILHLLRRLDLPALLDRKRSRPRDLVLAMLAQRLLAPTSKLAATRLWHTTTLAQELALDNADEDDLYDAMDWLLERQERIERRLAARHLTDGGHVLYDVSSSYYEGRACALAQFGYSRDGKRGRPIVVYGLMTDAAGRPVAVQAYEGNTADPNTVPNQVAKLRDRFGLERVVLVGDRGMLTQTQIDHLKQHPGLGWISALRHTDIRRLFEQGAVQTSLFDARNLAEITVAAYPDERLVVCHNPILAERRRRKRDALLRATEEAFGKIQRQVARRTRTPLTATAIAEKVGRAQNRFKMAKHFETVIEDHRFTYQRKTAAIEREAALDGYYVVRTSEPATRLDAAAVVRGYKNLARVERAFRSLKTVDLRIRPIYHRAESRVRAHIFLCMLAYYLEWHLRQALAPLLFHDEELDLQRATRDPVLPAQASDTAKAKKNRRRTDDGLPLHSMSTLLAELATQCRCACRLQTDPDGPPLERLTEPTPLQRRAAELIKTFPVADISIS